MLAVFVRPGVIVPEALSTQEAWTLTAPADPVVTWTRSPVEVRSSM
jgi:hypothetical protein